MRGQKSSSRLPQMERLEDRCLLAVDVELVKDTFTGDLQCLTEVNNTLYFAAPDAHHGRELWKSDGTAAGTRIVKDIRAGNANAFTFDQDAFCNVNGTLFFAANDGIHGSELWKSDGTASGTVLVKDLNEGTGSGSPAGLINVNGTLFFRAMSGLWKSDGTAAGTIRLTSGVFVPSVPLIDVNGTVFFPGEWTPLPLDGSESELWKSDGTVQGTVMVKDIAPGVDPVFDYFNDIWLYFPHSSDPKGLANFNGKLFFWASDDNGARGIWTSDGTEEGTTQLRGQISDVYSAKSSAQDVNGLLLFGANGGAEGYELWKTDGTSAGTLLVKDIIPGFERSFYGQMSPNINGNIFFSARDGIHGSELWASDGTTQGTRLVKDINQGGAGSNSSDWTDVKGTAFFSATDSAHGTELWMSDGTNSGTTLVQDLFVGGDARPHNLLKVENRLFFAARNDAQADKLWSIPLNHAPVLDTTLNPSLGSTAEDAATPHSTQVYSLVASAVTDADPETWKGIAVTAASGLHGTWQYLLSGGTWTGMGSPSAAAALLLPGSARVRFVPAADFNGEVNLWYRAWDQSVGTAGGVLNTSGNIGGVHSLSTAIEGAPITVTPVNDRPQLTLSGSKVYVHDKPPVTVAPYASVTDIDSPNFFGGRLHVWIATGSSASNRLAIGSGFMVDANSNVIMGTTIIGRRVSSGFGTSDLIVTFNNKVTPAIAQQLVRAITFKTVGGAAGLRTLRFTVSDGDGGVSNESSKLIYVT